MMIKWFPEESRIWEVEDYILERECSAGMLASSSVSCCSFLSNDFFSKDFCFEIIGLQSSSDGSCVSKQSFVD